jgi:hypothetical protein
MGLPVYSIMGTGDKAKKQGKEMMAVVTEMLERLSASV